MRKIKFKLLTQTQLEVLETSARTFGELKKEMAAHAVLSSVNFNNNQLIERSTKVAYQNIDEAVLPPVDCIMFQTATKTDSGCDLPTAESLKEMGYNELRTLGSKLNKENGANIDLTGKRVDILERMVDYVEDMEFNLDSDEMESPLDLAINTLEDTVELLRNYKEMLEEEEYNSTDIIELVTLEDLEEEAKQIQNCFPKK